MRVSLATSASVTPAAIAAAAPTPPQPPPLPPPPLAPEAPAPPPLPPTTERGRFFDCNTVKTDDDEDDENACPDTKDESAALREVVVAVAW